MHVLVLSSMYPNSKIYLSGVFVHEQVKALVKLGIQVTVIAPVPVSFKFFHWLGFKFKPYYDIPSFEIIDSIPIYHSKFLALPKGYLKGYWGYMYFWHLKKLLNNSLSKKEISLIHVHGSAPDDLGGYLLSKKLGVPLVLTIHGESVYSLVKHKRRFKNSKKVIEKADMVIAVSSKVEEKIKYYTERRTNIFKIYNGYSVAGDIKSNKKAGIIDILFVGNLIKRKGCKYLLLAMRNLLKNYKNLRLIIAGSGEELLYLKNFSSQLGISKNVLFKGSISHSEVADLMKECDIFVLPSWDEAFGVVYLEAMALKKPIIGTFSEGISDIVSDGENGILANARDVDNLTSKLKALVQSTELREKIGVNGYNSIKKLTWAYNASKTIEIYNRLVCQK